MRERYGPRCKKCGERRDGHAMFGDFLMCCEGFMQEYEPEENKESK